MMAKPAARIRTRSKPKDNPSSRPPAPPLDPLKPRPKLTLFLGLILIVWILMLIALWYRTVRPYNYYNVHSDISIDQPNMR